MSCREDTGRRFGRFRACPSGAVLERISVFPPLSETDLIYAARTAAQERWKRSPWVRRNFDFYDIMHYAFVGIASAPYLKSFWFAVMVGRRRIVDALRKETAYYWKRPYGRTQPWPSRIGDWEAVSGKIINTMWIRRSVSSVHDALELEEKLSHTLLPRQIGMVHMRLEGMTLKEIGAHFGISESRTCQVFSEINRRLQ